MVSVPMGGLSPQPRYSAIHMTLNVPWGSMRGMQTRRRWRSSMGDKKSIPYLEGSLAYCRLQDPARVQTLPSSSVLV